MMLRILMFCICFFLLASCKQEEQKTTLKVALWANESHTWFQAFTHLQKVVEERSGGKLGIEVYPSEQLAKESEAIRLIKAGVIDMTVTGSLLSNWTPIASFCEMPFLLKDTIEQEILIRSEVGKRIENQILDKVSLRPLTYLLRGPRHLTSNRPIRHPDELEGMLLRVPSVPSFVTAWNAMGAKPTPMALSEVFTALQQGTIHGQENPFALILSAGFPEVQKYVNLTEHVISWSYVVIGEKRFQSLSKSNQEILSQAVSEMKDYEHKLFLEAEAEIKESLIAKGMEFIEVDKGAFQDKCELALYESLSKEMQLVYDEIKDILK